MPRRPLIAVLAALLGLAVAIPGWALSHGGRRAPAAQQRTHRGRRVRYAAPARGSKPFGAAATASAPSLAVARGSRDTPDVAPRGDLEPLSETQFDAPMRGYRRYARKHLTTVERDVRSLQRRVRARDVRGARAAWTTAYGAWARVGGAYGAFGGLGEAVDGLPQLGRHVAGFHAIERTLWGRRPLRAGPQVTRLQRTLRQVRSKGLAQATLDPLDYSLRLHEILEDAARDQLSGRAVPLSGAGVAATAGAVDATSEVLTTLRPLLRGRGSVLEPVDATLAPLRAQLRAIRAAHRGWPSNSALTRSEHEALTARMDAALNALQAVPGALETSLPTDPPAIPRGP